MLEDYRKVMVERRGEEEQFTSENIVECMKKGTYIFFFPNFFLLGCDINTCVPVILFSLYKGQLKNFVLKLGRPGWMAMIYLDH